MKMVAEICDRKTGEVLYTVDVNFERKPTSKIMQAAGMMEAERRILEETFKVKWKKG